MSSLGGRLGPRIAEITLKALAEHEHRSADHKAKVRTQGILGVFRTMTAEKLEHISPLTRMLAGHPDTPPEAEKLLTFLHSGQGEASELLNMLGVGGALQQPLSAAIANYFGPAQQDLIRQRPNSLLDPGTVASALAARLWGEDRAYDEANRGGINNERFEMLVRLAYQYPTLGQVLEQLRRKIIGRNEAVALLELQRMHPDQIENALAMERELLAVPDAALAVLRGHISQQDGEQVAAMQGINSEDFQTLLYNTGEPPAAESMMEALRRKFIDDETFDRAILQSRIRDEWIPVMRQLRYSPMATADAIEAVVRNYISPEEGKDIAEQNGLLPEHYETLLEAHGRPPALGQILSLWNREIVGEDVVAQAIRESDIKDKYIDQLKHLRYKIPSENLILKLVEKAGMTSDRAYELLTKDGFEPDVAQSIVTAAGGEKVAKAKAETEAQTVAMYEQHMVSVQQAEGMLRKLGYSTEDADMLIGLADLKRETKIQEAAANAVRSAFLAHHITDVEVEAQLAALGLSHERSSYLLRVWRIELLGRRKTLTEAQIVKAVKVGRLDPGQAAEKLEQQGYSEDDAEHLLAVYA
jgi:hypothetical protein